MPVIAKFRRSNFHFFTSRRWLKSRAHVPHVQNLSLAEVGISKYVLGWGIWKEFDLKSPPMSLPAEHYMYITDKI